MIINTVKKFFNKSKEIGIKGKNIFKAMHKTVPAPVVLTDDPWFGPAFISDSNKDYMEREYNAFKEEAHKYYGTKEPENMHQLMYDIATKSGSTTIQLNPVGGSENFQGGSENIQK